MRIGIDLDGVVYNSEDYFRVRCELIDLEIGGRGLVNPNEWDSVKRHAWDEREDFEEINEKYLGKLHLESLYKSPLMPGVFEVIKKLRKQGHRLIAITARGGVYEREIELTKQRFEKEEIYFDEVIFKSENKEKICRENGIEIMIEDKPANVESISKLGVKVFYFRSPELPHIHRENIFEVYNWGQILRLISNMKKEG